MRRICPLFSAPQGIISALNAEIKGTIVRRGQKAVIGEATVQAMFIHPGLLLVQAKSLARESVFQRLSGQRPKWREFNLHQTMKRPCFFAEHGSGGGKTAAILAEFSSKNDLLAPLWFALKSHLLRRPPPGPAVAGLVESRIYGSSPNPSGDQRRTGTSLRCGVPAVVRPSLMKRSRSASITRTRSGCFSARSILSPRSSPRW